MVACLFIHLFIHYKIIIVFLWVGGTDAGWRSGDGLATPVYLGWRWGPREMCALLYSSPVGQLELRGSRRFWGRRGNWSKEGAEEGFMEGGHTGDICGETRGNQAWESPAREKTFQWVNLQAWSGHLREEVPVFLPPLERHQGREGKQTDIKGWKLRSLGEGMEVLAKGAGATVPCPSQRVGTFSAAGEEWA